MSAIYKAILLSAKNPKTLDALNPGFLVVGKNGTIEEVSGKDPRKKYKNYKFFDFPDRVICPGFVDTHNHLPQYAFAGIGGEELLPWLNKYTFPREKIFTDAKVAKASAEVFFDDLIKNGTTTTLTYTTIHKTATDLAFQAAQKSGLRAIIGKVMMDQNSPARLMEKTDQSIKDSLELIEKWHGEEGRLFYALTPRFAISCSFGLMEEVGRMAHEKGVYIQTHLAENPAEIAFTHKLFPKYKSYTDVYDKAGLLGPKTIMAHGIYLSGDERKRLKETKTKIAHCPTSNRFLSSGIMPFRTYQADGLTMGLGTDVAGGYSLSMLSEMKEAIENSKYITLFSKGKLGAPMTIIEAFYMATLGGARVLSMEKQIGSLEAGKQADFLVIDHLKADPMGTKSQYMKPDQILSKLIYRGTADMIEHVFVKGNKLK